MNIPPDDKQGSAESVGSVGSDGSLSGLRALRSAPIWVWAIVAAFAAVEPLTHFWIAYFPPQGTAPTGLHIPDSAVFIHAMRMFQTGFHSAYASCEAAMGQDSPTYFGAPFMWVYAAIGSVTRAIRIGEFMALGVANGVGMALYLVAVYLFLNAIAPKRAGLAFLLFTLGGGLGGVLYLITGALGAHGGELFEPHFLRYAMRELVEGPSYLPILIAPRLYYTLPLALTFVALTLLMSAKRTQGSASSAVLLCIAAIVNLRIGVIGLLVATMYLYGQNATPLQKRLAAGAWLVAGLMAAFAVNMLMARMSPLFWTNTLEHIRRSMWFGPFLSVAIFHILLAVPYVRKHIVALPPLGRLAAFACCGYLVAFTLLYIVYHIYYGVFWNSADYGASVRISDPSLIGALAGAAYALMRRPDGQTEGESADAWPILWLLAFIAVAISAWGHGWSMRLGPQRLMLGMGPVLALASASTLQDLSRRNALAARAIATTMVFCGLCSIGVSTLLFQGPLMHNPGRDAFAWNHAEVIPWEDAQCLQSLGAGPVIAPTTLPSFGDIVTLRGNTSLYGFGTLEFSDRPLSEVGETVDTFFSDTATDAQRRQIAKTWCLQWVYCPHATPIADIVLEQLHNTPWLEEAAAEGQATLFRVATDAVDAP